LNESFNNSLMTRWLFLLKKKEFSSYWNILNKVDFSVWISNKELKRFKTMFFVTEIYKNIYYVDKSVLDNDDDDSDLV
jgi:hypothetical protein